MERHSRYVLLFPLPEGVTAHQVRPALTAAVLRLPEQLAMLAALAYWGFRVGDGIGAWVLGVGAPLLAAVVWGAWVAPKARWPVPIPTRVAIEVVLFGAGTAALAVAGQPMLAVVLGIAALATSLLNALQERQAGHRPPDP